MKDLAIFSIASHRVHWLAARSAAVSSNIANADTPGYKARDVVAFDAALASAQAARSTSSDPFSQANSPSATFASVKRPSAAPKQSGNTVSLETELLQLGEVRSQHAYVTGIVSAFHRMLVASVKG